MKIVILSSSIIVPILMILLERKWAAFSFIFNIGAIIAALLFGNIVSLTIYQILKDNTVFMTNIHGILLNPLFLLSGAYLGVYLLYVLTQTSLHVIKK